MLDFYAGAAVGAGALHAHNQNYSTTAYAAMFGIDIPVIRAEIEYNYLDGSRRTGDIGAHAVMLNGYLKFLPTPIVKPYIGLGAGFVFAGKVSGWYGYDLDSRFASQGMLGIQVEIPQTRLAFDLEGRMMYASNIFPDADLFQTDVRLKARYKF
jgi:opacity protein-like surface antigen